MLTFRPPRKQGDGKQEMQSAKGQYHSDLPSRTRQEFKKEVDVNQLMKNFGVTVQTEKPQYQSIDYDLDLQTALGAVAQARRAHSQLPADLRAKYPTWQSLLDAIEAGTYETPEQEETRLAAAEEKKLQEREREFEEFIRRREGKNAEPSRKDTPPAELLD